MASKLSLAEKINILIRWADEQNGSPYSDQDIATGTNLHYRTVHALRKGEQDNPTLETLQALCDFFNISLTYFVCETEKECRQYLASEEVKTKAANEIAQRAQGVSPQGLKTIRDMIEYVRKLEGLDNNKST